MRFADKCQSHIEDALNVAFALMMDENQPGAVRMAAVQFFADHGYGRPPQQLQSVPRREAHLDVVLTTAEVMRERLLELGFPEECVDELLGENDSYVPLPPKMIEAVKEMAADQGEASDPGGWNGSDDGHSNDAGGNGQADDGQGNGQADNGQGDGGQGHDGGAS